MTNIKQSLIELFELEKMSGEKAQKFVERLAKLVFQTVLMRVLPILEEKDLVKYEEIVDRQESPEILFNFLKEKIPNFESIVSEESKKLYNEFSDELNALKS